MDIFNQEYQHSLLDLLRRSDFNDAADLFAKLMSAAHGQGKLDGGQEMAFIVLARTGAPPTYPEPAPVEIGELEDDIRRTVLAKFQPRKEESA